MELTQAFVGHAARKFREPVVNRRKDTHHGRPIYHIVEMTNHKIGIANVNINGHGGKHNASNTREHKVDQAAQAEEHRGGELDLASPEGPKPGENLYPGWHRDQHGCEHE